MEKKTMGAFLAALRKANGMTQMDLADRLNVSDKTVSRWERDDGAPDLSLIPVIAEIFGITCDELLRGERKSLEEKGTPDITPKGEKERQRLLKAALFRFRTQTLIAVGISAAGWIAALICNLAFLRAMLGFFCGAVCFAASALMQMICMNAAFFSVEDAGLEEGKLSEFRNRVIGLTEKSIGITVGMLGFTLPQILVIEDPNMGIPVGNMLLLGAMGAGVFLLIYAVVRFFLDASFVKRGILVLSEKETKIYLHNHKLKKGCAIFLPILLIVTILGEVGTTTIWGPGSIMKGTTFDDYESFIAYMEQDVPDGCTYYGDEALAPDGKITYFDEYGNEISEEEAHTVYLKNQSGDVVCAFVQRNQNVASIRYTEKDGSLLPITVCTYDDLREAEYKAEICHVVFACLYVLEIVAVVAFYFIKRAK